MDSIATFSNLEQFILDSVETIIQSDAPESRYRNSLFPLLEYVLDNNRVQVTLSLAELLILLALENWLRILI